MALFSFLHSAISENKGYVPLFLLALWIQKQELDSAFPLFLFLLN